MPSYIVAAAKLFWYAEESELHLSLGSRIFPCAQRVTLHLFQNRLEFVGLLLNGNITKSKSGAYDSLWQISLATRGMTHSPYPFKFRPCLLHPLSKVLRHTIAHCCVVNVKEMLSEQLSIIIWFKIILATNSRIHKCCG